LEAAGSAEASNVDAAWLLPVFRTTPLQTEARRGPARGTTTMGPYIETTESAAPALLVLSQESILVRITLCGVDTPCDGMTAVQREGNLGSPLREIRSAGSERGDGHKRHSRKTRPYPPSSPSATPAEPIETTGARLPHPRRGETNADGKGGHA